MTAREKEIWTDAVQSRPLHYFDAPTWPLLAAYCIHAVLTEELAADMRTHATDKLRKEHRQETAILAMLASRLRLGKLGLRPHQRTDAEAIARTPKRRLWE
jgi:hypothetical protein